MIGVIADDLAGAAELGGLALRFGMSAEIVIAREAAGDVDVVCLDTDSRSCLPEEAGRRVALAAKTLRARGAAWIYKKVDSVLRGQVVAELEAAMNQVGVSQSLLVPANPVLGRVIRKGEYFVAGKPIHETDFRLDPEHPRLTSSVRELLGGSAVFPVYVCGINDPLPSQGIIIGEAETAEDLRQWAKRCSGATLAAGAAEFFGSLLEQTGRTARDSSVGSSPGSPGRSELFVCGSASAASQDFMLRSRDRGVPVFWLPEELTRGTPLTASARGQLAGQVTEALRRSSRAVLGIGRPAVSGPSVAVQLAAALTEVAQAVLAGTDVGHVYAEGGATAVRLARRMGWTRLSVVREIAPGVVTAVAGEGRWLLTVKPGSYPWPKAVVG